MKPLLFFLFCCSIVSCKKDELSEVPNDLVGRWKLASTEVVKNGTTEWEARPASDSIFLYFSRYGESVNSKGELAPCGPTALRINGKVHKIKFHSPQSDEMYLSLCADCPTWNISLQGGELILNRCESQAGRMRFTR
jgi:hypothetical protein